MLTRSESERVTESRSTRTHGGPESPDMLRPGGRRRGHGRDGPSHVSRAESPSPSPTAAASDDHRRGPAPRPTVLGKKYWHAGPLTAQSPPAAIAAAPPPGQCHSGWQWAGPGRWDHGLPAGAASPAASVAARLSGATVTVPVRPFKLLSGSPLRLAGRGSPLRYRRSESLPGWHRDPA